MTAPPREGPTDAQPLPDDLARALAEAAPRLGGLGHAAHYFESIGSTNDVARDLAVDGAASGTMVMASGQTAGRGRRGRPWFSPVGAGLYVSLVLEPVAGAIGPDAPPSHGLMTLGAGVALAEGLETATGLRVLVKWPNDLVVEAGPVASRRKLGGILAEGIMRAGRLDRLVLGFGINLESTAYPPHLADVATSLEAETEGAVDRAQVLVEGLGALHRTFRALSSGGATAVLARWTARSPTCHGAAVRWTVDGRVRAGTTAGIDDDGALLVETDQGRERIVSADVAWV